MSQQIKIEGIYYFACSGIDTQDVERSLAVGVGDTVADYSALVELKKSIRDSVKSATGSSSTDEALIYFDQKYILFIGLGKNVAEFFPNEPSAFDVTLPAPFIELYHRVMAASLAYLRTRRKDDLSEFERIREQFKNDVGTSRSRLLEVIVHAADHQQRYVAAYALGQIAETEEDLKTLVHAAHDCDATVRNNAVRALGALVESQPDFATGIPHDFFIDLLHSPIWTDRNKAQCLLETLTCKRPEELLAAIRTRGLEPLIEMCAWPRAYAEGALRIIGRAGGFAESDIERMIASRQDAELFSAAGIV